MHGERIKNVFSCYEISPILQKTKIHYNAHIKPPLAPVLNQMYPLISKVTMMVYHN
jgi:hypothetical protein